MSSHLSPIPRCGDGARGLRLRRTLTGSVSGCHIVGAGRSKRCAPTSPETVWTCGLRSSDFSRAKQTAQLFAQALRKVHVAVPVFRLSLSETFTMQCDISMALMVQIATRSKDATRVAPGLTTRNKKLLVTKGIATNGAVRR